MSDAGPRDAIAFRTMTFEKVILRKLVG